ncbi:MAG TPA: hypothetical protein VFQ39_08360 [Longimicrobium sp.]|nr:hypothetical protein [Longimicrobium sp.]
MLRGRIPAAGAGGRRNGAVTHPQHPPRAEEDAIAYSDSIDRALKTHKSRSRVVSAVILVVGLLAVAAILLSGDRRRERAAHKVMVGDDSTAVAQLMGEPASVCPTGTLQHLGSRFPGGTPRLTRDAVQERLRQETARRWIYPDDGASTGCDARAGDTEIGFGRDGHVLWLVPVTGRETVVLPDTISI